MSESLLSTAEILGPVLLLIVLIWLVMRRGTGAKAADD